VEDCGDSSPEAAALGAGIFLPELNEERHEKGRRDEHHQHAHPFRRLPVTLNPSRLPRPPTEFSFRIGEGGLIGHRRASLMRSDIVWTGVFKRHIMKTGGRSAATARTAQFDSEFTCAARPAINTAEIHTAARTDLRDTNCIG